MNEWMTYDLYKFGGFDVREGLPQFRLWRSGVALNELMREFGFPTVQSKLRDIRHLEGVFLTPELFLIPAGKTPKIC